MQAADSFVHCGPAEMLEPPSDGPSVPLRSVLVFQPDQVAMGVDPCAQPGIVEEHQGKKRVHRRLVADAVSHDQRGEPDGFRAEILATQRVAEVAL